MAWWLVGLDVTFPITLIQDKDFCADCGTIVIVLFCHGSNRHDPITIPTVPIPQLFFFAQAGWLAGARQVNDLFFIRQAGV